MPHIYSLYHISYFDKPKNYESKYGLINQCAHINYEWKFEFGNNYKRKFNNIQITDNIITLHYMTEWADQLFIIGCLYYLKYK